ncbi:hypothetical protein NIES2100_35180 [Calothrix sp. NIES-2100]|uniref:hypothetical protein n=1 Tax=Calothrix sp. NIES-2100 TaxID=1954172 RepID=UPI000B5ED359|nr:hypothetical protein NIES2100_35180 [Calothrix sp. NIES-2100]
MERNRQYLKDIHRDFLCLLLAGQRDLTKDDIRKQFEEQFPGFVLTDRQIADFKRDYKKEILEYQTNDKKSFDAALKNGLLEFATRYQRIVALEKVIHYGLYGYTEDVVVGGRINTVTKKDPTVVIRALAAIKDEVEQLSSEVSATYQISVELVDPPIQEDEIEAPY